MSDTLAAGDIDGEKLKNDLKLLGDVIGVGLPNELSDALSIPRDRSFRRSKWRTWINELQGADVVLVWVGPRKDDDQLFMQALAAALARKAVIWSFHAMGAIVVDRLTGDAVQTLLEAGGLKSGACANAGFGYYARSFTRDHKHPDPITFEGLGLSGQRRTNSTSSPVTSKPAKKAPKKRAKKGATRRAGNKKTIEKQTTAEKAGNEKVAAEPARKRRAKHAKKAVSKKKSTKKRKKKAAAKRKG